LLQKIPEISSKSLVTCEINPYLMYFTAESIADKDTILKAIPPIRDTRERELTLKMFNKQYFDVISSNHFPVLPKYKLGVKGNFFKAISGLSCIGFTLPLIWTVFNEQRHILGSNCLEKEE
jgi:allantoinase